MAPKAEASNKGGHKNLQTKSPAEFFAENKNIAGFDNPGKCLYTSIRELVENALDSSESIRELPLVEITVEEISRPRLDRIRGVEHHNRLDEALYEDFETEAQRKKRVTKEGKENDKLQKLIDKRGDNTSEVNAKRKEMAANKLLGQARGSLFYKVTVRDNGSGMAHKDIPNMLGKVLSGTKYGVKQTRGKFGLGAKMALIWSKMTTGLPFEIYSTRKGSSSKSHFILDIDIHKNEPNVHKEEILPNVDDWHGAQLSVTIEGNWGTYRAKASGGEHLGSGVEAPGRARARAARPLSSGTSALYQVDMECDEAHATAVKGALHARMAPLEVDCGRMRAAPAMLLDSGGPVDDAHYLVRFTPTDTLPWTPAHVHSWLGANGVRADWVVQYQCGAGGPVPVQWRGAARGQGPAPSLAWLSAREPGFVASVHGGHAFVSKAIRAPHVECRQRTDAPSFCRLRVSRLPLSMLGPARPARAAGAAGAPAERQKRVQVDQLLAERRAFEDRQKATAAAAAVGAAAAAVGKEALQADRDREERMLDATQSAGRKRAGDDEELDAADDAPLGTPVGLRQPEPRRGEAAFEAAEDGEEGRRMARRRTGGDEGGVAMPAAAPAAAGPDGIPVDVWRKLGEPAFVLLAAVFTAVGAAGETPPGFLDGVVASIYKAKDAADAANYRPLTMLGSDYRILAKVLATRWTPLLAAVVGPEQTAFLAGRRISDNICLTQMLPGLLAANAAEGVGPTGAALALLDFRKAYDTIDRGCLLAVMEAVGVGDGVLAWTRTILTHTYASAEVNGFISEPRRYAAGVRQGCPAAPALFLFLGHALACFLRTCPAVGVEVVPGCRVTCPQYADDCMPLLRSCAPAAVAALVEAMAVFGRATGLVLNLGKCGILPLGSAGEGLLAGAEVAGLRVLDAGVSLGVPVSAGLPPPEAVTGVCAGLRTLEAAVPGLWRLPLLSACKEPIWRLWVWLLQPPAGVRAGVWAVVAALVVDAMERGCRHLWRITRPRDGVLPPDRTVSVERAGALATMDLWNALASFAEGGVMPRGWAGVVGPTHPYVGVVDGKLILNKAS
ncbi:hypothetical protein FOA52_005327 [Chlamydomonas sp. UWO 241]|nr:hypothetical protein FOA52_005327 [Chlamydomonas sp. UWO 241]